MCCVCSQCVSPYVYGYVYKNIHILIIFALLNLNPDFVIGFIYNTIIIYFFKKIILFFQYIIAHAKYPSDVGKVWSTNRNGFTHSHNNGLSMYSLIFFFFFSKFYYLYCLMFICMLIISDMVFLFSIGEEYVMQVGLNTLLSCLLRRVSSKFRDRKWCSRSFWALSRDQVHYSGRINETLCLDINCHRPRLIQESWLLLAS